MGERSVGESEVARGVMNCWRGMGQSRGKI